MLAGLRFVPSAWQPAVQAAYLSKCPFVDRALCTQLTGKDFKWQKRGVCSEGPGPNPMSKVQIPC